MAERRMAALQCTPTRASTERNTRESNHPTTVKKIAVFGYPRAVGTLTLSVVAATAG